MKNNFFKGIIISVITLIMGYLAVALPLNLFNILSKDGQRIFFIAEISIYLIIGTVFLIAKDKKEQQIKKQNKRHKERKEKIKEVQENWYNIAA